MNKISKAFSTRKKTITTREIKRTTLNEGQVQEEPSELVQEDGLL
ncbi:MAG TPA: hypothetical protein VE548_05280 [Nitrososphaeraceae archaeon]|nr:hypothetical protein [Nitrososphaeraceae archaeon]